MNKSFHSDHSDKPHPSDAGCFQSEGETECIIQFDLAGKPGRDGRDGQSHFRPPATPGAHGYRGGDATPAERGEDANDIEVRIAYASDLAASRLVDVSVEFFPPHRETTRFTRQAGIGDDGYLFFDLRGGKGGNGGNAGQGGPGAKGRRGRNATRYSSGTSGGAGGNGGNAGQPTDGKSGGEGGTITVTVDENHLGLLMLVKGNLAGGDIGFAGSRAAGGLGGQGGRGGSSYHWTERRTRTVNGKRQSYTVFRSNPGGPNGRRGRDGAPSFYRAKDGTRGQAGNLAIHVQSQDGKIQLYGSPYDLQLVSFDIACEYAVLEPDSLVSLDSITIRNSGGMPTPENYSIEVFLPRDEWLLSEETRLTLPQSLAPDHSYTFSTEGLRLRLGDYVVDAPRKRPFGLDHLVSPIAMMESGIHRPFRQFENGEQVELQFPIQLSEITALNSLAPGESTRVRIQVTNISNEMFGEQHGFRSVRVGGRLLGGDLDSRHLVFFDSDDQPHDWLTQEFREAIRKLKPGESRQIETRVGIKDSTEVIPYQNFVFGFDLFLQRPGSSDRSDQYRCVDYRKEMIRVSERYRRDEGSRFLLIANRKTDVDDIEQWTQLADYFGSGLDVWDVSYYGFLDLVRDIDQDESLLEQWRGMTIIIPNNYYMTADGKTVAFKQLAKSQFLKAASDHDINFYVMGDSRTGGSELLETSLIPVNPDEKPSSIKSQRDFLKQVSRWSKYMQRTGQVLGGRTKSAQDFADSSLGAVHEFEIEKRTILFQPKKKWLEAEARRLQRKLRKTDPLHRWIIVHRYDTGDTDTSWGFFKKRKVGKLEARRTLDTTKGSAVLYEVNAIEMADDNFITSDANKHAVFMALKFEDKVDRFIRLASERTFPRFSEDYIDRPLTDEEIEEVGHVLIEAILVDLYNEQLAARTSRVWGARGVEALLPKLNYLAERSLNYGVTYSQMMENEASMRLVYELLGNLRYMARRSRTIWDFPIFPTALFKRSRAVTSHMMDRIDRITTSIFGSRWSWWDKWSSSGDDYDPFGGAKKKVPKGRARDIADERIEDVEAMLMRKKVPLNRYTMAQTMEGLTYDPELLSESKRVLSGEAYDKLVAAEAMADLERAKTEYMVARERSELLVPLAKKKAIDTTTDQNVSTAVQS